MTVTLDQAREAKEELKPILRAIFNGQAAQIGLGSRPDNNGGRDYGVAVDLKTMPAADILAKLPKKHITKSNAEVPVQYRVVGANSKQEL
jgi:hypothetical protein